MKKYLFSLLLALAIVSPALAEDKYNDGAWKVTSAGVLAPVTTNTYAIGTTALYPSEICLGGTCKSSWGSVVSPWEDAGTTTVLTSAPTAFVLTHSTGNLAATKFTAGSGDIALENGQTIDGGTNNKIIFGDNSDTATIEFTGDDVSLDASDGGYIFTLTDATDGTVDFMTNNDVDDYIQVSTSSNQPLINFVGCNGKITAASGSIDFDNENLATTGTLVAGATTVTSLVIGDETIARGTDDIVTATSNDASMTVKVISGSNDGDASLFLVADKDDDAADDWILRLQGADNALVFINGVTEYMNVSASGNIIGKGGDLTLTGTTPSVTIGDAGEEDTKIVFDGNAIDYHAGLDDSADALVIGVNSTLGTETAIAIKSNANIIVPGAINFGADAGASDSYNITLAPAPAAYTTGMHVVFSANTTNTGACTIDIDGAGALVAKSLKSLHDTDPADNYIEAGSIVTLVYDGTNFQIQTPDANP